MFYFGDPIWSLIAQFFFAIIKIVCVFIAIAYYTLAERKIMASVQRRRGPNVVGFWGLLQPLADGLKLFAKEVIIPSHANKAIFFIAPVLMLTLSLLSWSVIPFYLYEPVEKFSSAKLAFELLQNPGVFIKNFFFIDGVIFLPYSLLFLLAISSLNVYGIIMAGWSSNSKYSFLGALRSAAQMISYEVAISLIVLTVVALAGSLDLIQIVFIQTRTVWFCAPLFPSLLIFCVAMLAETNRAPFDLPEAEAELVAGYNVEYSSMIFAMFFLGEYSNMILMSTLVSLLFFGGWDNLFFSNFFTGPFFNVFNLVWKTSCFCVFFILVRASYPRYRYDQLMDLGWKIFLPVLTGFFIFEIGVLLSFKSFPSNSDLYYVGSKLPTDFLLIHSINEFKDTYLLFFQNINIFWFIVLPFAFFLGILVTFLFNPIHALLSLISLFFISAILLFTQNLQFLGLAFLIIYVGAVAILFLFVLMLFNLHNLSRFVWKKFPRWKRILFLTTYLTVWKVYLYFTSLLFSHLYIHRISAFQTDFSPTLENAILHQPGNDLLVIATSLYTNETSLFFNSLVNVLLLAMLGALILALSTSKKSHH